MAVRVWTHGWTRNTASIPDADVIGNLSVANTLIRGCDEIVQEDLLGLGFLDLACDRGFNGPNIGPPMRIAIPSAAINMISPA